MPGLSSLKRLLQDPPPDFVFEIAPDALRMARCAEPGVIVSEPLPVGAVSPSPIHENVVHTESFSLAVAKLASGEKSGARRTAAILLPDHCAYVAVLDFDNFPDKPDEQLSLVRFRMKRSVPFDVDAAAISYWVQDMSEKGPKARREVLVAVTSLEIVSRYEAPFRAAGFHPGFVSLAPLAVLDLIDAKGVVAVARLNGSILSLLATRDGTLKVIRSIEMAELSVAEIAGQLHPTLAFVEDNLGAPPRELLLAGFGALESVALSAFPAEFQIPVRTLGGSDTAIRGYLRGLAA